MAKRSELLVGQLGTERLARFGRPPPLGARLDGQSGSLGETVCFRGVRVGSGLAPVVSVAVEPPPSRSTEIKP